MHEVGDAVVIVKTEKMNPKFISSGFQFTAQKELADGSKACFCVERGRGCKARIKIRAGNIVAVVRGLHSHAPNHAKAKAAEIRSNINDAVADAPERQTGLIVDTETTGAALGLEEEAALPSNSVLKRTVRKRKQATREDPPIPAQFDFLIPDDVRSYSDGSPFLMLEDGDGAERFLVFSSRQGIEILAGATRAFSDGTYKVCPKPWKQLYTLAVEHLGHHVPVVFILTAQHGAASYRRIFEAVAALCPQFRPLAWMADYELAAWNAVRDVWGVQCSGCLFHHSQAVFKYAHDVCGLGPLYDVDEGVRNVVGCLSALSLVPEGQVQDYFELLAADADTADDLLPLLDYFAGTWVGRQAFGRNIPARFPPATWNHYGGAVQDAVRQFRTNNSLEGLHNAFKFHFGVATDFWSFCKKLKIISLASLRTGLRGELGEAAQRARGTVAVDKRIHDLAQDFANRPALRYLRAQAANIGAKN